MARDRSAMKWLADVWSKNVAPPERLTVTEWADKYRMLSEESSSEPGPWRTSRTPYLKEIMDCLSPTSPIRRVAFMKGSQVGGTEALYNAMGHTIDIDPGPILVVMPTVETAERNSRQRIEPMLDACARLKKKIGERRSRTGFNTLRVKKFPGGVMMLTGANSPAGLRSMPVKFLFMDEVDAYPANVDKEGDPVLLASRRVTTFANHKIAEVSTPKIAGISRIERAYNATDKRKYFVPCPSCNGFQTLEFGQLKWPEREPEKVLYECILCNHLFPNSAKDKILRLGEWRPTQKAPPDVAGFHLSALYSPVGWESWSDIARLWESAQTDENAKATFINCSLGLPVEQESDAPAWESLHSRAESYRLGTAPPGVSFVTVGVDVQRDRLEVQLLGWGRGKRCWVLDYKVFMGDVQGDQVWSQLTEYMMQDIPCTGVNEGRTLTIRALAIDSGAYSPRVYAWARDWNQPNFGPGGAAAPFARTVVVVKGQSQDRGALLTVSKVDGVSNQGSKRWVRIQNLGTPVIKSHLYTLLKLRRQPDVDPPNGYIHFPALSEKYFEGLVSEKLITYTEKGYPRTRWELPPGKRNEALDTWVYGYAAALVVGLERFVDADWDKFEDLPSLPLQPVKKDENIKVEAKPSVQVRPVVPFDNNVW